MLSFIRQAVAIVKTFAGSANWKLGVSPENEIKA